MKFAIVLLIVLLYIAPSRAQSITYGSTDYRIEALGSAATDARTPFWIVSNKYGAVPLEAGNAYMRAGVFHQQAAGNSIRWNAGVDIIAATPRHSNVYIQQLYAGISFRHLNLTIGSKENYTSLWDKDLSSGDMVISANARPIPEINISTPQFVAIPRTNGWMQFRGHFAVGKSFDTGYIESFINGRQDYIKNTLWHHKSLHLRLLNPDNYFPFTATLGIRHHAQWGGTSTNPDVGEQPRSLKDFMRIVAGKAGDANASASAQKNVLGNHYGAYDIKLGYLNDAFDIHIYKQHFFEDASGMELYNLPDGLYGIQLNLPDFLPVNKLVIEYLYTRDQSGPVHYIDFDRDIYPGQGGGRDDYYNNEEYTTGVSYFNRSIGSPLITSPEYNDGHLGFRNNRVRAFHIGFKGYLSEQVAYRILATSSENWGTMNRPFLRKEYAVSCGARISYCHPRLEGWLFSGEVAADFGSLYGNNTGVSLSISKSGLLKRFLSY